MRVLKGCSEAPGFPVTLRRTSGRENGWMDVHYEQMVNKGPEIRQTLSSLRQVEIHSIQVSLSTEASTSEARLKTPKRRSIRLRPGGQEGKTRDSRRSVSGSGHTSGSRSAV